MVLDFDYMPYRSKKYQITNIVDGERVFGLLVCLRGGESKLKRKSLNRDRGVSKEGWN